MIPNLQNCVLALGTLLAAIPSAYGQDFRASTPAVPPAAVTISRPAPLVATATAATTPASPPSSAVSSGTIPADALRLYLEREATGLPGRVEVTLGALDPRINLGDCRRIEPFMPVGARLWGRGYVGVRCAEGSPFTAFLPVTVRVTGPALVLTRALPAGSAVTAADVRLEETELTREPPGALADFAAVGERVLTRPLAPGQMLRAEHLRVPPAVAAGDAVKVLLTGRGFSVATEGRAVTGAAEGQTVRVQTASGKTLSGVARAGRVVQVGM